MVVGFSFWYKKEVISKKKVFVARNLKDFLPNLPLKTGNAKKKIKVVLSSHFLRYYKYSLISTINCNVNHIIPAPYMKIT